MKFEAIELELWNKWCRCHAFEEEVYKALQAKRIYIPTYLSTGQEHIACLLSIVCDQFAIFPQHRCHSYYLAFGGNPELLAKELLGRHDGCNGGMAGSASISLKGKIFGHSGLLGDQIPIACGYADSKLIPTVCVGGDAAFEEDYALGALGYAVTRDVPILFIVEDNGLSILTKTDVRRSWDLVDVANALGIYAFDATDRPQVVFDFLNRVYNRLPALLNIQVCRHYWHAGAGSDGPPAWNTYVDFKNDLYYKYGKRILDTEKQAIEEMSAVWQNL